MFINLTAVIFEGNMAEIDSGVTASLESCEVTVKARAHHLFQHLEQAEQLPN